LQGRPIESLENADQRQIAEHQQDAQRREPVVPLAQGLTVPRPTQQPRKQVGHDPHQPDREHAEHHQVRVAHDPVGEMDQGLEGQRHLQRTLQARQEVEHHAGK
jgi:hypothetical protein